MTLSQFITKYNGKIGVGFDGVPADDGQCVQLVELCAQQVIGVKLPVLPDAASYWERTVPGYTKIAYKSGVHPITGDFVVFSRSLPGSEGYGHIDICIRNGSASGYLGLDSNWSPDRVTEVNHTYEYVLGYLRHTVAGVPGGTTQTGGTATVLRATYVRTAPNLSAPLAGSKILNKGDTFKYIKKVAGQNVNQKGVNTNIWYHSTQGHYVWAGNCKG